MGSILLVFGIRQVWLFDNLAIAVKRVFASVFGITKCKKNYVDCEMKCWGAKLSKRAPECIFALDG